MSDLANISRELGPTLRARRKQLGLTQQDVADIAGVQRQTVGRVERGATDVALSTVTRIALAVGLELRAVPRYEATGR